MASAKKSKRPPRAPAQPDDRSPAPSKPGRGQKGGPLSPSKKPPAPSKKPPAPAKKSKKPAPPRTTIPVEDEWFEPGMSRRPVTIPVSDAWIMPDLPRAPKPPPLPRIEIDWGAFPPTPPAKAPSKRPPKRPSKRPSKEPKGG